MKLKKIMSLLLICSMVLSCSMTTFAADSDAYSEEEVLNKIQSIIDICPERDKFFIEDYDVFDISNYSKQEIDTQLKQLEQLVLNVSNAENAYIAEKDTTTLTISPFVTQPISHMDSVSYYTFGIPNSIPILVTFDVSYSINAMRHPYMLYVTNINSRIYGTYIGTASWTQKSATSQNSIVTVVGTLHASLSIAGIPVNFVGDYTLGIGFVIYA